VGLSRLVGLWGYGAVGRLGASLVEVVRAFEAFAVSWSRAETL